MTRRTPDASREQPPVEAGEPETVYCDNCGEPNATNYISWLDYNITSANAGESAVLCDDCAAFGAGSA